MRVSTHIKALDKVFEILKYLLVGIAQLSALFINKFCKKRQKKANIDTCVKRNRFLYLFCSLNMVFLATLLKSLEKAGP